MRKRRSKSDMPKMLTLRNPGKNIEQFKVWHDKSVQKALETTGVPAERMQKPTPSMIEKFRHNFHAWVTECVAWSSKPTDSNK